MDERRRKITCIILGVALIAALTLILVISVPRVFVWWSYQALANTIEIGWTRKQVTDHLGKPKWTMRSTDDIEYLSGGWGFPPPDVPIRKDVLVYQKFVWLMFVYVDDGDKVTDIALART